MSIIPASLHLGASLRMLPLVAACFPVDVAVDATLSHVGVKDAVFRQDADCICPIQGGMICWDMAAHTSLASLLRCPVDLTR